MNNSIILVPIRKVGYFEGGFVPDKFRAQFLARKRLFYYAKKLGLLLQPGFKPKAYDPKMSEKEFVQLFSVTQWKQLQRCVIQALGLECAQKSRKRYRERR